ncbi:MAG: hypothetical protein V3T23_12060 [Nitrososphaerales archaeon]
MNVQRIYNQKFYVKKQMKKVDEDVRNIQAAALAGTRKASLIDIKQLAKRVYNLGAKVERITLDAIKYGAGTKTIDDLRDLANILEFYSVNLYENAKKLWYTNEIPHFLIFKTVLDPASDLEAQAEAVREMNLVLGDGDA